ncbi:uncharacterized protein METZ01_LOCUS259271, partial [marine metagenome]
MFNNYEQYPKKACTLVQNTCRSHNVEA